MSVICNVVVGTYEKLILGYELLQDEDNPESYHFKIVFTNNAHLAPVRCLAIANSRGILASAGSDEAIRLLDLKRRVEIGSLPFHSGSINALHFYKATHLFSCSDDGKLVVWRRRDWRMLKAFKRHRGQPVRDIAVHPTGALALSVGDDKTLRTWDLVAGKNAFSINLKKSAQFVEWSPDGSYFAIVFDAWIDVYSAETGRVCSSFPESESIKESSIIPPAKKITTAVFISNNVILFGMESGRICSGLVGSKNACVDFQAHNHRIKGICLVSYTPSSNKALVITSASDGEMKLWRHRFPPCGVEDESFLCITSHRTDFRILSMAVWNMQDASTSTQKKKTVKPKQKTEKTKISKHNSVLKKRVKLSSNFE